MNTNALVQALMWPELLPGPDDHSCTGRHCAVCEYDRNKSESLKGESK